MSKRNYKEGDEMQNQNSVNENQDPATVPIVSPHSALDEGEEKRITTTSSRYQVCDPVCGLVSTASSLQKALSAAKAHPCEGVEVFDVMARRDCAQVWDAQGAIKAFRGQPTDRLSNATENECLMADCKDIQSHFCVTHCLEVFANIKLKNDTST